MLHIALIQARNDIVSETIGDESIVINLQSGRYHRVSGVASAIWASMATLVTWDRLLEAARPYSSEISSSITARFVTDLVDASLVVVDIETRRDLDLLAASAPSRVSGDPVLESYDDMADLLLLDPVHDVSEQGWPAKPKQAL